jgi:hypothetical protein
MVESSVPPKTVEAGHELTDLSPKSVALFGTVLALTIIAAVFITAALFRHFYAVERSKQIIPSPLSYTREPTPGPKLSVNPSQELQTMRAAEDSMLNSYQWIDREKGLVRIPIDRAIELLAQRGLPARAEGSEKMAAAKPLQRTPHKNPEGNRR